MSPATVRSPSLGGVFHQHLDELIGLSAEVPGSRHGSAIQDLVLSIELFVFFIVWLRQWPRVASRSVPLFIIYAANLLGAALWCGLGVYIHLFEPLPTERTTAWLSFLALGAVTPVLFPLVASVAFAKKAPTPAIAPWPYVVTVLSAMSYLLPMSMGADLSLGGLMPQKLWLTPWHAADGRSYGGQAHGIAFDLMSSYPCYRGDCMFVLSTFFMIGNLRSVAILHKEAKSCSEKLRDMALTLRFGIGLMLVNCMSILYLLVVLEMTMTRVFDAFHAFQGLIMAASFFSLLSTLRVQEDKTA